MRKHASTCRAETHTDKNYPAEICSNVTATAGYAPHQKDAVFCSNAYFPITEDDYFNPTEWEKKVASRRNATCVTQCPGCGGVGKPCCIGIDDSPLGLGPVHIFECNKGAACPGSWNESTLCVADNSTST